LITRGPCDNNQRRGAAAEAQTTRTTPMRRLAGFPPGGNVDILARIFAERLSEALGRLVMVPNKPGTGGQVAAETLKDSTLHLSGNPLASGSPISRGRRQRC
jgi:tripartite-type tricarboxylate transporter receptor subunit TctC